MAASTPKLDEIRARLLKIGDNGPLGASESGMRNLATTSSVLRKLAAGPGVRGPRVLGPEVRARPFMAPNLVNL